MQHLHILNSRDCKKISRMMESQWGASIEGEYAFLENNDHDIFIVSRDIAPVQLEKLRVNSLGLYIGENMHDGMRLSIEGSQLLGPKAIRNVAEVGEKEMGEWLKGKDIALEGEHSGFVIVKHGNYFVGCGKAKEGKILNFVPKARRISVSGELP